MNRKQTGIALIVIGAAMLFFSEYIAEQVTSGKAQIRKAEGQVNTIDSVFSSSKYTSPIGKQITGSAKQKIRAGQAEVDKYETVVTLLRVGGGALIVVGGFMLMKKKN